MPPDGVSWDTDKAEPLIAGGAGGGGVHPHSEGWSSGALQGHGQHSGRAATIQGRAAQNSTESSLKFYLQRKLSNWFLGSSILPFHFHKHWASIKSYAYNLKGWKERFTPKYEKYLIRIEHWKSFGFFLYTSFRSKTLPSDFLTWAWDMSWCY